MRESHPWVLGVSASHNGAACLLHGDRIVAAVQEERLSRVKRHRVWGACPARAIDYCLRAGGIDASQLDVVVGCSQSSSRATDQDFAANPQLAACRSKALIKVIPHHLGHAISAFALSGFRDATVVVIDGMGSPFDDLRDDERDTVVEHVIGGWETASVYHASNTDVRAVEKHLVARGAWLGGVEGAMPTYGSLGGMYSATALQLFGNATEAGKVMGLAPYGRPSIPVEDLVCYDGRRFSFPNVVQRRFQHVERWPRHQAVYEDLAASVQAALEEAVLALVRQARSRSDSRHLCYAGGVALNSVLNERIVREAGFADVFVLPAAEDSGVAIGAAFEGLWGLTGVHTRQRLACDAMGRHYDSAEIDDAVRSFSSLRQDRTADPVSAAASLLADGMIVGWFQGGSELGPRALGQRSILCDPRRSDGKEILNQRVKYREAFRPFAPVVALEDVERFFELDGAPAESPFMLRVCRFREAQRAVVPAVVHVDGTGRLQTVTSSINGPFYDLVKAFGDLTGVPLILNTSFNVMGEPIVESPYDALRCLTSTGIDACVFGDRIVFKA